MAPDVTEGVPAWLRGDADTVPVIVTAVLVRSAVYHPPRDFTTRRTARLSDLLVDPAQVPIARPQTDPRRVAAAIGRENARRNKTDAPVDAAATADRYAVPAAEASKRLPAPTTHSGKPMQPNLLRRIDEQRRQVQELSPLAELGRRVVQLLSADALTSDEVMRELRTLAAPFAVAGGAQPAAGAA